MTPRLFSGPPTRLLRLGRPAALALVLTLAGAAVQAEPFERTFQYSADELTVANLIGHVRVEGHAGDDFRVVVNVRGDDATTDLIRFDERSGRRAELVIQFPTDEHQKYVYPELGMGSSTISSSKHGDAGHWLDKLIEAAAGDRITVRGRSWAGGGLELWADVVVQVPHGRRTDIHLGVGTIDAADVQGDTQLRTRSGAVSAEKIEGPLLADTGSGRVDVRGVQGDVHVDTGSGRVDVADVRQARTVLIDTGSGSVDATDIACEDLRIDTGSGGVDVLDIDVKSLAIDTGSGRVSGDNVATDDLVIDTGSGGVDLALARMGGGRFQIDTGSGGIRLELPEDLSAEFDIDTGSGRIDADLEGVDLGRRSRREARFTVGGGDAQVTLSTGSGGVRLVHGRGRASRR